MNTDKIMQLKSSFYVITQAIDNSDIEFWYARDLMDKLGYTKWQNFILVVQKARSACEVVGVEVENHFTGVSKMVELGSAENKMIKNSELPKRGKSNE